MGDSPRAVSNQRKGPRFSAQPLNQPRGFEPRTSSFRGGRFAHCATWTPWLNRKACCGKKHDGSYKLLDDASLNDDPGMRCVGVDTFTVGYNGKPTLRGKRFCTVFVVYATRHEKIYLHKTKAQRLQMFRIYWTDS